MGGIELDADNTDIPPRIRSEYTDKHLSLLHPSYPTAHLRHRKYQYCSDSPAHHFDLPKAERACSAPGRCTVLRNHGQKLLCRLHYARIPSMLSDKHTTVAYLNVMYRSPRALTSALLLHVYFQDEGNSRSTCRNWRPSMYARADSTGPYSSQQHKKTGQQRSVPTDPRCQ